GVRRTGGGRRPGAGTRPPRSAPCRAPAAPTRSGRGPCRSSGRPTIRPWPLTSTPRRWSAGGRGPRRPRAARPRVGPLLELLDDPGQLAARGVGEPVGERLRSGPLDVAVAHHLFLEVLHPGHSLLLGPGEVGQLGR